jgi:hypothetical protein
MPQNPLYQRLTKTATSDLSFKITTSDKWFEFLDIFVYTNNAYVGDINGQDVLVAANAVYTITAPVNALDLVFKNAVAGSNTVIVIAGTEMSERRAQVLGLVI